ncbi:conserved hypothetical protein [Ricinus communis]|uniref:Uncharacterized protein n=1 Tax=Ricinus communis TaxID=3988 RepID=B9RGG3_RICCO|nr:conserved hypothetical protein [Ricinus communis]
MASFLIPNSASLTLPIRPKPTRATFKSLHGPTPPVIRFSKTRRGSALIPRAGPSTSSYVFAFVFPLSLLIGTIITSIRIADKLDRDYLEEVRV